MSAVCIYSCARLKYLPFIFLHLNDSNTSWVKNIKRKKWMELQYGINKIEIENSQYIRYFRDNAKWSFVQKQRTQAQINEFKCSLHIEFHIYEYNSIASPSKLVICVFELCMHSKFTYTYLKWHCSDPVNHKAWQDQKIYLYRYIFFGLHIFPVYFCLYCTYPLCFMYNNRNMRKMLAQKRIVRGGNHLYSMYTWVYVWLLYIQLGLNLVNK